MNTITKNTARTVVVGGLIAILLGCETVQHSAPSVPVASKSNDRIHLHLYDAPESNQLAGRVTLVAQNEPLKRAIRAAYPDAPIKTESGVRLDQRIDVWAEGLSSQSYLQYLGSQIDASILLNEHGEIEVKQTEQWQFTLPKENAFTLMPQAIRIAEQTGARTILMGEFEHILLLVGKPSELNIVRSALNQLSDRITLERNLSTEHSETSL